MAARPQGVRNRRIGETVIKTLFALSGNSCAFADPATGLGCEARLTDPAWNAVRAQIAHIRGPFGTSPRFDPDYPDPNDFHNLLLLCPNHHWQVDWLEPPRFTVEVLVEMKVRHEQNAAEVAAWASAVDLAKYAHWIEHDAAGRGGEVTGGDGMWETLRLTAQGLAPADIAETLRVPNDTVLDNINTFLRVWSPSLRNHAIKLVEESAAPRMQERIARVLEAVDGAVPERLVALGLSEKQLQVLRVVAVTKTVGAAAEALACSSSSLYASLRRIARKLGTRTVPELVMLARAGNLEHALANGEALPAQRA